MKESIFKSDKILRHIDRVYKWKQDENPFAITVEFDLTNVCNHRCPGCSGGFDNEDEKRYTLKKIKDVIYSISRLGAKAIIFTGGGEPLCHPDIVEAIDYAHLCGLDVGLITNGGLLHTVDNEALLKFCKWIRVSLDAGSRRIHRLVHGADDFIQVLKNIMNLVLTKEHMNTKCTIGTGYLTGKRTDSFADMVDFVSISIMLGVDYAQFRPFHSGGKIDFSSFNEINFDRLTAASTKNTKIVKSEHKYNMMAVNKGAREYDVCYGHQFATTICANGDMTICCHTRGQEQFTIGNVYESEIYDIWNSERRQEAIKKIDLSKCPLLCRCDGFNKILWDIKNDCEHVNFL